MATGIGSPASLRTKGIEDPFWIPNPLSLHMYQMDNVGAEATDRSGTVVGFQALLNTMHSISEAGAVVADGLMRKLAKALSMPGDNIAPSKPIHVYGVNSLVAVEMGTWLAKELLADVTVFEFTENISIASLGSLIAAKSQYLPAFAADDA